MWNREAGYVLVVAAVAVLSVLVSGCMASQNPAYRWVFLYGVPALLALLSIAFRGLPRGQQLKPDRGAWWLLVFGILLCGVGGIVVGYGLQYTSFTYGDQAEMELLPNMLFWAIPVVFLLATFGWEVPLRGHLPVVLGSRGWGIGYLLGILLSLPWIVAQFETREVSFLLCSFVGIASLEAVCTVLVLRGAGLFATGVIRGVIMLVVGHVLSDWNGLFFTAYLYVTTGTVDYVVIGSGYLLALLLAVGGSSWIAKK